VINRLINDYFLSGTNPIKLSNLIIFSPSFSSDDVYKELRHKMMKKINPDITKIDNIRSKIDTEYLK